MPFRFVAGRSRCQARQGWFCRPTQMYWPLSPKAEPCGTGSSKSLLFLAIPADTTALRGTVVAHIDFAGIPALSGIGTMSNLTGLVILAAPTNPGNATLECTLAPILDIGWRGVSQLAVTWRVLAKCSKKGCPIQLYFGSRLEIRQETRVPELHPGLIRELAWLERGQPARRRDRTSRETGFRPAHMCPI